LLREAHFVIKVLVASPLALDGSNGDVDPFGGFFERMALADELREFHLLGRVHDPATFVDVWAVHCSPRFLMVALSHLTQRRKGAKEDKKCGDVNALSASSS
jgi:hypothetical protein